MTLTPYRMNLAVLTVAAALVVPFPTGQAEPAAKVSRPRPGAAPGNLVVVVPPIPKHGQLHKLCHALLEAQHEGLQARAARVTLEAPEVAGNSPGAAAPGIRLLIDATGGTQKSAAAWCGKYLHLSSRR